MKKERPPTAEEFQKLLEWLDPDPEAASRKYGTIHSRLTRMFISRACIDPEELADEVMNRVAVRIEEISKTFSGDPALCFYGYVTYVCMEYLRDLKKRSEAEPFPIFIHSEDERQQEDDCLTRCMDELTAAKRYLFCRYFRAVKREKIDDRKRLAEELGVSANALRIRAHHIRRGLRQCMDGCLNEVRGQEMIPV